MDFYVDEFILVMNCLTSGITVSSSDEIISKLFFHKSHLKSIYLPFNFLHLQNTFATLNNKK